MSRPLSDLASEFPWIGDILRDRSKTSAQAALEIAIGLREKSPSEDAPKERGIRRWRRNHLDDNETTHGSYNVSPTMERYLYPPVSTSVSAESISHTFSFDPDDISKGWVETDAEGGNLQYSTDTPIETKEDWNHVFELFHLDPEKFYIVDETVKTKTWQQSKRLENGDRDTVQLYSYGCRFQRRLSSYSAEVDIDAVVAKMMESLESPTQKPLESFPLGAPCTFVVCWADLQLGKDEGGGVKATVDRFLAALEATESRIRELRATGRNITKIVVANMGDPVEGCAGNYAQQTFVVELNQRDQLVLALNMFALGLSRLAALVDEIVFISVLCNHGEWNRKKGKSFTDDADNAGGFIADTLKLIFDQRPDAEKFRWVIPRDEMIVSETIDGVHVAFTHGHKMPQSSDSIKAENTWLQNQSMWLLRQTGKEPNLWVTAHRHHGMILDFGPWWRIQCSALDGGSKWYQDASGKWSTPGVTTFLVGEDFVRKFSDYAIL